MIINREIYWDKRISFYVVFYFIASVANATIKTVLNIYSSYISMIFGALIVLTMLISINEVWRRSSKILVRSLLIFLVLYIISFLLVTLRGESFNVTLRHNVLLTYAWWIPIGLYAYSVKNIEILYKTYLKGSLLISVLLFVMLFSPSANSYTGNLSYNMFFGFNLVVPCMMHLNEFLRIKKKAYIILFLIELLAIIFFGNRGALIPILFFVVYRVFYSSKRTKIKIFVICCSISIALFIIFQGKIIQGFNNILVSYGIQSRTLTMFMLGNITDDSGRSLIWEISRDMVAQKPFLGWGLGGEYSHISKALGSSIVNPAATPHNGIVQNFVNFGILGGILSSLLFIIPLFRINKIKDDYRKSLVLIFASFMIVSFVSSDGFFIKPEIALFIYLYLRKDLHVNIEHKYLACN